MSQRLFPETIAEDVRAERHDDGAEQPALFPAGAELAQRGLFDEPEPLRVPAGRTDFTACVFAISDGRDERLIVDGFDAGVVEVDRDAWWGTTPAGDVLRCDGRLDAVWALVEVARHPANGGRGAVLEHGELYQDEDGAWWEHDAHTGHDTPADPELVAQQGACPVCGDHHAPTTLCFGDDDGSE